MKLLSLFITMNMLYNDTFTKKHNTNNNEDIVTCNKFDAIIREYNNKNKNMNLGNDERDESYFTDNTYDVSRISIYIDILDEMNKLKNIENIHSEIENIKNKNTKIMAGNIKSGLSCDW